MDFSLSDEQKLIVETARRIGEDYGVDYWHDLDRRKAFPQECWQAICDAGLA
ncbi:acyl-CoA dehydrogenase family protein, partial [Bordetella pertussis]